MTKIINRIRQFVKKEASKPESKYGFEPFKYHFIPTVEYAQKLCDKLGGDKEVVTLAAWLHDSGSLRHGRTDHHKTGAKIAEEKLRGLSYREEKIELIKKCILHHRGSQESKRESIEEKIVAEADALSNFENLAGLFKAAFIYEGLDQEKARISVLNKLEKKYKKLHFKESREMIKPKIEAIRIILKNTPKNN